MKNACWRTGSVRVSPSSGFGDVARNSSGSVPELPVTNCRLVELRQLLAHHLRHERDEDALLGDGLLALLAQHEPQELLHLRLERLAGRLVHEEVHVATERILVLVYVLDGRLVARPALLPRHLEHFHVW